MMTDTAFERLLGASPTAHAANGWSRERIMGDLRARGQDPAQAGECAAHLEMLGLPMRPMTAVIAAYLPEPMTDIDLDLSVRTKRALQARMKRSYYDAWRAVVGPALPELAAALYVEDHAVTRDSRPRAIQHGWVELAGRIVETTDIEGGKSTMLAYFPGLYYAVEEADRLARELGDVPIAWQLYGWGGYDHPAMPGSALAAWLYVDRMSPGQVDYDLLEMYRSRLQELTEGEPRL